MTFYSTNSVNELGFYKECQEDANGAFVVLNSGLD